MTTESGVPEGALRDVEAARSAAKALPTLIGKPIHAAAVAECLPCTARFLAQWVLDVLGPEPVRPVPPGPADPPRKKQQPQWSEHPGEALASPPPASPAVDTYTATWWASLTDDERWAEFVKLRGAAPPAPSLKGQNDAD